MTSGFQCVPSQISQTFHAFTYRTRVLYLAMNRAALPRPVPLIAVEAPVEPGSALKSGRSAWVRTERMICSTSVASSGGSHFVRFSSTIAARIASSPRRFVFKLRPVLNSVALRSPAGIVSGAVKGGFSLKLRPSRSRATIHEGILASGTVSESPSNS